MKTIKRLITVLSASALAMTAAALSASADTNISITDAIQNSVINGNLDINTITSATGMNVNEAITTIINGAAVGGDTNINTYSQLMGGNVSVSDINLIQNTATKGDLSINNIHDILGINVNATAANAINGFVGDNLNINTVFDTHGLASNLNAAIQNTSNNAVYNGDFSWNNVVNNGMATLPENGIEASGHAPEFTNIETRTAELVNKERGNNGKPALTLDKKLTEMANYKAQDMVTNGFSHDGSYGSLSNLLSKFGISYSSAGENIAKGQKSPEEVVKAWMNSQGHRENILGNYTRLGVGYTEVNGTTYWVLEFAG